MSTNFIKIGIFDSGLGGLSVVRELLAGYPSASVLYFGDIAHVPYGGKPLDDVRDFALGIVDYLLQEGAGAILMACNMSSAVALDAARANYPYVPIAGVIEAGARAALSNNADKIAVLATEGTVAMGAYEKALHKIAPQIQVTQTACPDFVPLIERGELSGPNIQAAARRYLTPGLDSGARTIILGCTHYPFLLPALQKLVPDDVKFIDPAGEAVKEILTRIGSDLDTINPSRFILSAPSSAFRPVGSRFLGRTLPELELAGWDSDGKRIQPYSTSKPAPSADKLSSAGSHYAETATTGGANATN